MVLLCRDAESRIGQFLSALGYTLQRPQAFSEASTGAADDLARAADIARNMVVRFGTTPELGQVAYETEGARTLLDRETLAADGLAPLAAGLLKPTPEKRQGQQGGKRQREPRAALS